MFVLPTVEPVVLPHGFASDNGLDFIPCYTSADLNFLI